MTRAAPPYFPYPHRTLAEVYKQQRLDAYRRRPRSQMHVKLEEWDEG